MCFRRSTSQMVYGLRSYSIGRHSWVSANTLLLWGARLVAAATSKAIVLALGILHRFTYLSLCRKRSSEARRGDADEPSQFHRGTWRHICESGHKTRPARGQINPLLRPSFFPRSWHTILQVISCPQPDPQRPKLPTPKVKQQHQRDTSRHAGEIESATGVEMMHVSHSSRTLLLHIVRRCSVFPAIPHSQCRGTIRKAPATPLTIR